MAKIGRSGFRWHDLRHTAALAIANGAHSKAIQERMGHASITVTLDPVRPFGPIARRRVADALAASYRDALGAGPETATVRAIA